MFLCVANQVPTKTSATLEQEEYNKKLEKELSEAKSANYRKSLSELEAYKRLENELLETRMEKARMEGTLEAQQKVGRHT